LQCCFTVNFPFAVTYSSSNRIRFFISGTCDPTMEVIASHLISPGYSAYFSSHRRSP
jgi:hypothetical protein